MERQRRVWDKLKNLAFVKKILGLPPVKKVLESKIGKKLFNYETISYIFFGVLTTVVNYTVYVLLYDVFSTIAANSIAWVAGVLFAYVTNKIFVFESKAANAFQVLREFVMFVLARVASLLFENAFLWLTVDMMHWNGLLSKAIAAVGVVIMNYVFSKLFVFIKPKTKGE